MNERKQHKKADAELDRELEETFPASDPPQVTRFKAGEDVAPAEDDKPTDEPEPILPPAKDLNW